MKKSEYIAKFGVERYEEHREKMRLHARAKRGYNAATRPQSEKMNDERGDYLGKTYYKSDGWKIGCVDKTKPDKLYIDKRLRVKDIDCDWLSKEINRILHNTSGIDNKLVVVEYLSEDNLNIQIHIKSEKGKELVPTLVSILPQIEALLTC